jgi:hypothetical protein
MSGSDTPQIVITGDLDEVAVEMELVGDLVGQSDRKRQQHSATIGVKTPSPEGWNWLSRKLPVDSSTAPVRETGTGQHGQHRPKFAANVPGVPAEVRMKFPLSSKTTSIGSCFIKARVPFDITTEEGPTPRTPYKSVFQISPTERMRQTSAEEESQSLYTLLQ